MTNLIFWIWLSQKIGVGSISAHRLLEHFGYDPERIYNADWEELLAVADVDSSFCRKMLDKDLDEAYKIAERCFLLNIKIVPCNSELYPKRLKNVKDRPILLYMKGKLIGKLDDRLNVAVVGTRNFTEYGRNATFRIVSELCGYNTVIVSGGARGIDTIAAGTAIYYGTDTVAVLGAGLDITYPPENEGLFSDIANVGLLVSEYPPGTAPTKWSFPQRNRIISGLSDAVLVGEAGARSGALITARRAVSQDRPVYAIPGPINAPTQIGNNSLIRDGAKLCTRAEDILEDFSEGFSLEKLNRKIGNDQYLRYDMRNSNARTHREEHAVGRSDSGSAASAGRYDTMGSEALSKTSETVKSGIAAPMASETEVTAVNAAVRQASATMESNPMQAAYMGSAYRTSLSDNNLPDNNLHPLGAKSGHGTVSVSGASSAGAYVMSEVGRQIYAQLDSLQKKIIDAMTPGKKVEADSLTEATGLSISEILSALTVLEIYSAVEACAGGCYRRLI